LFYGKIIYYYPNGNKQNEGEFHYRMQVGDYFEWYENGNKQLQGHFTKGIKDSL